MSTHNDLRYVQVMNTSLCRTSHWVIKLEDNKMVFGFPQNNHILFYFSHDDSMFLSLDHPQVIFTKLIT